MSPAPEYIVSSMKLTFSKLDTYGKCPLRFRLRYQQKLPDAPRGGRNLSLILHRTLESFLYSARRDSSLATLLQAYENRCAPPQTAAQQRRFEEGRRALEAFHWREGHRLSTAVALEQRFSVSEQGVEVAGRCWPLDLASAAILFFHGNGENLETVRRSGLYDQLAGLGAHVLAVRSAARVTLRAVDDLAQLGGPVTVTRCARVIGG